MLPTKHRLRLVLRFHPWLCQGAKTSVRYLQRKGQYCTRGFGSQLYLCMRTPQLKLNGDLVFITSQRWTSVTWICTTAMLMLTALIPKTIFSVRARTATLEMVFRVLVGNYPIAQIRWLDFHYSLLHFSFILLLLFSFPFIYVFFLVALFSFSFLSYYGVTCVGKFTRQEVGTTKMS